MVDGERREIGLLVDWNLKGLLQVKAFGSISIVGFKIFFLGCLSAILASTISLIVSLKWFTRVVVFLTWYLSRMLKYVSRFLIIF